MMGNQFRGQRSIEKYTVDFVCLPLKLIVEVDGYTHETEEAKKRDIERDSALSSLGYTVLRFSSWEVLNAIVDVQICIGDWIKENGIIPPPFAPRT
jgi:very-short-patch-repair endonuclease